MRAKVTFVTSIVTHYRERFHNSVREILDSNNVDYNLIYSYPSNDEAKKSDTVNIEWAKPVKLVYFGRKGKVFWQRALSQIWRSDLVVIGQENRFLLNYFLQLIPARLRPKVALWGHGRNFKARDPQSRAERWKAWWATRAEWWFAYTDETSRHIQSLGFPIERITVFNNSIDVSEIAEQVKTIKENNLYKAKIKLGVKGKFVGVFVGGIYPDKRISFLVESADRIRLRIPDFELIVVGGGSDLPTIHELSSVRPWMHVMGPLFGRDKVELMMLGHVYMMPGLIGLGILDAGVVGLPVATTAFPWHSPEIAYLEPGRNGIMVSDWENPDAYANAVADLLLDPVRQKMMSEAARAMANKYSIEAMAQNFAKGVLKALSA